MLNPETAKILFDNAAALLQRKSRHLALVNAVNNPEKMGLTIAATTVDETGQITYDVYESRRTNTAHASLNITKDSQHYLVEVNPGDPDRMSRRLSVDNYATTKFDDIKRRIYSTFHENNLEHEDGDLAAIQLFQSVIVKKLATTDSTQINLSQLRANVKPLPQELTLSIIRNSEESPLASFTKNEISHALNLLKLFQLTSIISGSDLPRK